MRKNFLASFISFSVILFASCATDKTPEPVVTPPCIQDGQVISYANDIVPILNTYCNDPAFGSCHQSNNDPNASGFDYTTYDGFASEAPDNIVTFVLGPNATMPKSISNGPTAMTDCDKLKLQTWLDQGVPNN